MDEKRRNGYVTGLICLLICSILSLFVVNNVINYEFNQSAQIVSVFAIFFGGLGGGSLWKPETIGAVATQILENLAKSGEDSSDSHDYQPRGQTIQESHGSYQVMAQRDVNINVPSEKKETRQHPEEEKESLHKETIIVRPSKGVFYEFSFEEGECLKGEISSTSCIDIYFVDDLNFDKWVMGKDFDYEYCNEDVLEADISYVVPDDGTWYLIIENDGRKNAKVKVRLFTS
jgi:hypothetical protein